MTDTAAFKAMPIATIWQASARMAAGGRTEAAL
jgi:hypothetical protein